MFVDDTEITATVLAAFSVEAIQPHLQLQLGARARARAITAAAVWRRCWQRRGGLFVGDIDDGGVFLFGGGVGGHSGTVAQW